MKPAISITDISKQYTLGNESITGQSFREMIIGSLATPFRKFSRLSGTDQNQEKFWALEGVSFDVEVGEVVGIIGRNGAGKSTLLKILSRITTPTRGSVSYQGRLASLLEVGTGFHPELTGRENIYLNGAILGMTRKEITLRMEAIVEFAELSKFLDTPVKRYSSGMYVRLAFSVAAHLDPDILVVDEVLAVGDLAFQQKCLGKLQDAAGNGRTVLFVSHNMTAMKSLCSRIIYINEGHIDFDGSPDEAIGKYLLTDKSNTASWEDTHQQNFHLKGVTISSDNKNLTNLVQFSEETHVSIQLEKVSHHGTISATRVTDVFGNIIFTSWDRDNLKESGELTSTSKTLRCTIPAQLLKPGNYTLTVFVRAQHNDGKSILEEANLDLTISNEQCSIPTDRLGLISPIMKWQLMS